MEKNIYSLLCFLLLVSFASFSQTGKVAGVIIDGEFVEPLAFANVLVKGTTKGATSDFDGKYELELEPGTYTLVFTFVGYSTQEITGMVIKANEVATLDITLNTNSLDTVVISTTVKRNTENAVLNLQRKSVTLLDGLSAQSIKSSGAGDLAAAVKSVPGVSIADGKYVYVRGLGDRYTKSILNGIDIPGLDPDRNTVQMDLFPTNIIDNVIVIKSAAAEYPADFTGGVVDIVTKDFPTKAEASLSLGMGYNPEMHFNNQYLTYTGSNTDFFGYDDGTRNLPIHRYQPIPGTFDYNSGLLTSLTDRFSKELSAKKETSNANFDLGFTLGNQYDLGRNKIGYQASFSYKNTTTFYENRIDGAWMRYSDPNTTELGVTLDSRGSEGINNVILNGLAGIVFKTDRSKYKVNLLHIQNGESTVGIFNQIISQSNTAGDALEPLSKNALTYTERSVTNILLNGDHRLSNDENAWNFEWKLSPTFAKVYDKDHRITPLQQADNGNFFISPSASTYPIQLWRSLVEENWAAKFDFKKKYNLFNRTAQLKFGTSYVYKYRDFNIDAFTFQIVGDGSYIADGNVDNLLSTGNLWTRDSQNGTIITFGDRFNPDNAYEGENQTYATYISNEFNLSESLKAVLGLRAELYTSYYTSYYDQDGNREFDHLKVLDNHDLFPSANVIYSATDKINIRGSYSRTTARPSFKEQSNAEIFDPITNRLFIGTLDLVPTYINNFDLRLERFGEEGQMIALSGFYKDFKDPLEITFFASSATQLTPANLGDANVYGLEFEFRQKLGFITEGLDNLKINANVSYIKSALTMADSEYDRRVLAARTGETIDRERNLQGQSPYLINVGLDYNNENIGLQTGLFYNVQGKTLEVVGTGIVPDVYTQSFNSLNFTLNKSFGDKQQSSIDFKVSNILGDDRESFYKSFGAQNQTYSLRSPGTEFSLGYTYKF